MESTRATERWQRLLARTPQPIRIVVALWLMLSLLFNFALPSSVEAFPPILKLAALLPMATLSAGLAIFMFWRGCVTLYAAGLCIMDRSRQPGASQAVASSFIGGIAALNIFMIVYMFTAFGIARAAGDYRLSVALSILVAIGLTLALIFKKQRNSDVTFLFWGALVVDLFFGAIMATVAVPPI